MPIEQYINLNSEDRFRYIEYQEINRSGLRFKLEQSALGRLILCIFCCIKRDPIGEDWNRHRKYLLVNRPALHFQQQFEQWARAAERVNRMVIPQKRIQIPRPFVQNPPFVQLPPIVPAPIYVVPPAGQFVKTHQVEINNQKHYPSVNTYAPQPVQSSIVNVNPFHQHRPTSVNPQLPPSRNHRPTSVNPQTIYQ